MNYSSDNTVKAVGEFIKGKIPDLSGYAKLSDIPTKLPADGGNSATVNGHTVNADVPANAKFTDTVQDLTPYAKKAEIPTSLPANGGTAALVTSLRHETAYSDIFSTTLTSTHGCWNKWCFIVGSSNNASSTDYIANAPETATALWYEVLTGGRNNRAFQIAIGCYRHQRNMFIRYMHDNVWSEWNKVSPTTANVETGSVSGLANGVAKSVNTSFTPKVVILYDSGHTVNSGFALAVRSGGFTITPSAVSVMGTTAVDWAAFA